MADGELYAGTVSNFQGNEPTIYRSQESRISLKTENSLNWLQGESRAGVFVPRAGGGVGPVLTVPVSPDPVFVGSAYLRESLPAGNPEGDDDKVYFFFSETGKEFDYFENTIVSRIARVCKVGTGQWGCAQGVTSGVCGDVGPPCTSPSSSSGHPGGDQHPWETPLGQLWLQITQPKAEARVCCSHWPLWCQ